ncbi:MAG: hypothetical protein ABIH76_04250, partial [Candidatus Bathyarchaeota archaeon]
AYQGAVGLDIKWLRKINFFTPTPDLILYLDISPKKGLSRKGKEKTVFEQLEYELKVREIYLDLAKSEGFTVVNGERKVELVHKDIMAVVSKALSKGQ